MSNTKKLQEKLERLQGEKAALVKERGALKQEQRKLEGEAAKSLAGVAVGKLLGQAQSQAERRVEAESLQMALEELNRRIEEKQAEIVEAQDAIGWAREAELRQEARELLQAVEPIADDLAAKALRLSEISQEYHPLAAGLWQRKGEPGRGNTKVRRIQGFASRLSSFASGFKRAHAKATEHKLI